MYSETSKWLSIPEDIKCLPVRDFGNGIGIDFLFSLGGDGTLLEASMIIGDSGIPIVGINMGRLGFLASIEKKLIAQTIDKLINREYTLESALLPLYVQRKSIFSISVCIE
ncbi:NAD(+)/NADH kinase [Candidatus Brachybacter algidus]|uniref:NAD(+)/NADH kinase n=1 Tax=Candidatus Brachybacter algidus TaxID=2982024 RepID=UPI00257F14C6|nr:NAD(+)/NADH kinase [Candidatus Brachybacter algidus]